MQFLNQVIRTSPSWLISVDEICRVGMLFICMRLHAIQLSPFWFSAFAFEKIPIASFLGGWACLGQRLSLNDVHRHLDTNGTQVEVNHKTDPRFALNCNDLYQGLWVCFHFRLRHYMKSPCFFVGIPYCLAGMMGFPQDFWTGFAVIDVSYLIEGPRGDGGILSSRSHAPIATTSEPCSRWPNVAQMGHKWRVSWMVELYPLPCGNGFPTVSRSWQLIMSTSFLATNSSKVFGINSKWINFQVG